MRTLLRPDLRVTPHKLLVGSTWLLALALTAWILASWYWRLNGAPVVSARPAPLSDPGAAAQEIASRQLFGAPPVATTAPPTAPVQNLVLVGVSTRWGKLPGFALIRDGSAPARSFIEGEEISPGTKLIRVHAESVEIERNGVREQIQLNLSAPSSPENVPNSPAQPGTLNQAGSAPAPAED